MKKNLLSAGAAVAAAAGSSLFCYAFPKWVPVLYVLSVLLLAAAAGVIAALFAEKKKALMGLIAFGTYAAAFFGLTFLINNVMLGATRSSLAAAILCGVNLVFFPVFYLLVSRGKRKRAWAFILGAALCAAASFAVFYPEVETMYYKDIRGYRPVASPVAGQKLPAGSMPAAKSEPLAREADFFVSVQGDDEADGSFETPFKTIERARDAVRLLDKTGRTGVTVAIMTGVYRVDSLIFTKEDSGTAECPVTYTAYGDGEVVVTGGASIPFEACKAVSDEAVLSRLSGQAKDQILSVDLTALGVTAEQYGKIYAIGGYNTAGKYDGDWVGPIWCELFINDGRQTIARYPNGKEYLYTGAVVEEGEGRESASAAIKADFESLRNPKPDVYKLDGALSERIAGWKEPEKAWMFGYWRYDWADGSTPLGVVDHENLTISPMFVSGYGAKKDAPYYFFNVLEELDAPGEWYLDRDTGMLYFYPPEGFDETADIMLSLSTDPVIRAEADHLVFEKLTVTGTRGDAVQIDGDGNTVKNCTLKNVAGNALLMTGTGNLAVDNEITRTGRGGVILTGGDRETLTPGDNRAENNLVHDWSEIYETYQPAFTLNGVGNVCAHNEMYNSPHEAVTYSGNNHLIEYNLIHDVNLLTDDGGAIYSGRRWDWYGNVIRYNLIYDLGANGHRPVGIYMDDALAGQTIYGNLIVNAPNYGLQLGGGQDLDVHDNVVVNSFAPVSFDARGLSGLSGNESSSFYQHYKENGELWKLLWESPWQSETWQKAYPQYQRYSDDFSNVDDKNFVLNPGNGTVKHNVFVSASGRIGEIADEAYRYSDISENGIFRLSDLDKLFVDPDNGDYTLREDAPVDFKPDIPAMSEFGRSASR